MHRASQTGRATEDALTTTPTARPGARAAKRRAITQGARTVFGREGYSRTSIEAIAAEAGVSTRTIYNHFQGKDQLFSEVLHDSASQVADAFIATVDEQLTGTDARADLLALGHALVGQRTRFPDHFAMIRQIRAEAHHFPPAVIDTWQQAGPHRVHQEVTRRLTALTRTDAPAHATAHFIALVDSEISPPQTPAQIDACVTRAVDAFLHGYRGTEGSAESGAS
ncbi:TetR/AcrR family transcriptional regulator [Streptomyces sp. 4F14]|uniref:TetR/AcrR family transcriptional regulator n=1 Tax=Streptomyces sp. 4F14 TaxID=3394380 RepID=UPI003A83B1AC